MKRRLFNIAAAVSLLLCVGTVWLWARSYYSPWYAVFGAPLHNGGLETGREWAWRISSARGRIDVDPVGSFYLWHVSYWKIAALWLAIPARSALLHVHQWWAAQKPEYPCGACGYDLRATPECCPECGTVPVAKGAK